MTLTPPDATSIAWPEWMLRYVGSNDVQALDDLIWSVGGSPPYGGVSYDEGAAVYELLEDYRGPGAASSASYDKVRSFIATIPEKITALEIFQCADAIHSAPKTYDHVQVDRGLELSRQAGHRGAEATFLSFDAELHFRSGNFPQAIARMLESLDIFLELADADSAYEKRAAQSAQNAVSYTAISGNVAEARDLLQRVAGVLDSSAAEQLRLALQARG